MQNNLSPQLITDQMKTLETLYREDYRPIDASVREAFSALEYESIKHVYTLGDGDSYHASLAAEMAFQEFAKVAYSPYPAMKFLEYGADYIRPNFPRDTVIIGISASGGSSRVVQGIERAKQKIDGVLYAGLVGKAGTPVANAAERLMSTQIPELGRAPGIRTYVASMMGLYSFAIRLGEIKRHLSMEEANGLRDEIANMAGQVVQTYYAAQEPAKKAAQALNSAQFISFVGSGPSFGSAYFSSAKVVESCGVFTATQDLEEWAHVERFAYPLDYPVLIIAPPGKAHWRAVELAKGVKMLGHPVLAVAQENDKEMAAYADYFFPVIGDVRESFSPLLYYIAGTTFAYELTLAHKRCLFMTDNEKVMAIREEMNRQIQG